MIPGSPARGAPPPRPRGKIPKSALARLPAYASALQSLAEEGVRLVSPAELAGWCGFSPAQIQKDLAHFGELRLRGKGYPVQDLLERLKKFIEPKGKIPEATVNRLSTYGRILNRIDREGVRVISSAELARRCGLNPAQIRKDLAYFGEFGVRGKGYDVKDLKENLKKILGVTRIWRVALVGAGNLGSALLSYKGFLAHGFTIDAVFDKDPEKVQALKPGSPPVRPMDRLAQVIREMDIRIAIVAVPSENAQGVVGQLVEAGVTGILNFAPIQLTAPPHVRVLNVDLGSELEHLAYHLSKTGRG